jgi:hypothetical protein
MKPYTIDKHISWYVLSDIKNWNLTWARYMFSDIRTYIPAYGYIMWLEVMHETEEPICIGNSEG